MTQAVWRTRGQLRYFNITLGLSVRLVRRLPPIMPLLTANPVTLTVPLWRFSTRPWRLGQDVVLQELRSFAESPSFDKVFHDLVYGRLQEGAPPGSTPAAARLAWLGSVTRSWRPHTIRTAHGPPSAPSRPPPRNRSDAANTRRQRPPELPGLGDRCGEARHSRGEIRPSAL
ncbi:MAG: hypothetical protein ACRDZO_05495 [Egibacteraceae bacterium]